MAEDAWGRVEEDGTVYVRSEEGERAVGSYPGATPEAALAYFTRKFEDLAAQVRLLEQRLKAGQVSPADADRSVKKLREDVTGANAVGDLAALLRRLDNLGSATQEKKAEAEAARQEARSKAVAERAVLVETAETLAATDAEQMQWKSSGDRMRQLFEEWQAHQQAHRLDKKSEDELWKRFSHARTLFDRKRRQFFGALDEQHGKAKGAKEALIAEAEALASSTDWAVTAGRYRDLMARWKTAGRASRKDDDALWARFRAAQDAFFSARQSASDTEDASFRDNLVMKEQLLVEAEALVPVKDLSSAKARLRSIQEKWDAAGKVPRGDLQRIEARLKAVEQAVRDADEKGRNRGNPQARALAEGVVQQLETAIAGLGSDLEAARAAGNERKIRDLEESLAARQAWLDQARSSLREFSG